MSQRISKIIRRATVAWMAAALAAGTALPSQAETLKFLLPWGATSEGNMVVAQCLMNIIEETTAGEIKLQKFDNSVVPPFEQFEPVASGVFDLHYTNPAYHSGNTVIGQLMDTVTPNMEKRHESGLWDMVDEAYQTRNLKVLALGASTGFQFFLRNQIGEAGSLEGLKIRSNPAYDGTIRKLGGAPIQLPITEVYTSLQKGLIDGTAFPAHGVASSKMWEVADYMARPMFGQGTTLVAMNLDKWNGLSLEIQAKMLEAGTRFENECYGAVAEVATRDEDMMKENGMEITEFGTEAASNINQYYNEGIWERAEKNGGDEAKEIISFIKDNGLVYAGRED
ncbi:TRAP transporter substrate-binding protein DctP [Oricola sp.]|uniref:TRAP transporter substrate-binding protein n=1 Tax=Oricola sp. TaxID=1979950 RepID=UPI0025FCFEF4|nr:TRAP transporter substrate-binding protein DctP [Oricola sp.]MCI5076586.1 TRAP transporter substrate-binding protein DctP [Oricola sp.]